MDCIEFKDSERNSKVLVPLNNIRCVWQMPDFTAFVETDITGDGGSLGFATEESYENIKNLLENK